MKILNVLNPSLHDYAFSGAARLGINVGEGLKKFGHTVDYIASDSIFPIIDGITSVVYEYKDYRGNRIISDTIEYAVQVYKSGNYDAMFINIHQISVLNSIDKLIPKDVPVVYTQHTPTILGRFSLNYRDAAYNLTTDKDRKIKIISPCLNTIDIWKQYINSDNIYNVQMIHNGIDDTISKEIRDLDAIGDYYFTCGRIVWDKGSCEIAEMCARARKKLIVVGSFSIGSLKANQRDIDYYNQFAKIVEDNSDLITWIKDPVSNDEVRKLMNRSRAFILASTVENCALAVSESMSVGVPILYIEEPSTKEVTTPYTAKCIPLSELHRKSWDKKMDICADYLREFDNNIKSYNKYDVMNQFYHEALDINGCTQKYEEVFEELIK